MMWKVAKGLMASVMITGLCFASAVFIVLIYLSITEPDQLLPDDVNKFVHADGLDHEEGSEAEEQLEEPLEELSEEELEEPYVKKSSVLHDAPLVLQYPELPRGCEVTTLTMLLLDAGYDVDKMQLADEMAKDTTAIKYSPEGGIQFWGHPNRGFVGNITLSAPGFGAYHKPMFELLSQYDDAAVDLTNEPFELIEEYISKGRTVMAWTTVNYKAPEDHEWIEWDSPDGIVRTTFKEHAVLLTGYDEKYVYLNDPLHSEKNIQVSKARFIQSWEALDSQALALAPEQP